MKQRGASHPNKKVANSLVAMSSAAVLAVYTAGYVRTQPAADRFARQAYERSLAREIPPAAAARSVSLAPAVPVGRTDVHSPAPSTRPAPKGDKIAPPKLTASAPAKPTIPVPVAETAPLPAEQPTTAAAVAVTPAAAPATAASPVPPAAESQAAAPAAALVIPAPPVWKDGKYTSWGTCLHGDIQATVVIEGGKIISAEITDCRTRYACDVIDKLPGKVIQRQKNKFDVVGGATESAYAYYGAVYWALDQASK
jgi:uncharacterized protein with FMN-binding domain